MINRGLRSVLCAAAMALLLVPLSGPKVFAGQERFTSGQNVAPVFEGWVKKPDGTFDFYFGYLNRNWTEEPIVPIGPDNSFSPGPIDRNQPTYFYPRRNEFIFTVNVPADWGPKQELIWTLTVHGKTDKAYGWLKPEWEIDALLIARNPGNQAAALLRRFSRIPRRRSIGQGDHDRKVLAARHLRTSRLRRRRRRVQHD